MVHLKNKQVMNRPQMATMAQDRGENLQKKTSKTFSPVFFSFVPSLKFIFAAEIESGRKNQGPVL